MKDKIIAKQDELIEYLVGIAYARGFKFCQPNSVSERLTNELAQLKAEAEKEMSVLTDLKTKPNILIKIRGDAGTYPVWGVDWLNHKMLVERACGYEQILFDKITILESDADAQNNGVSDREILFWMMNESSTQWEGSPSYEWVCRFYKALRKGKVKAHRDNLIKKGQI